MKNKLIHFLYFVLICVIILVSSAMNVIEDEMRVELACKNFILDLHRNNI